MLHDRANSNMLRGFISWTIGAAHYTKTAYNAESWLAQDKSDNDKTAVASKVLLIPMVSNICKNTYQRAVGARKSSFSIAQSPENASLVGTPVTPCVTPGPHEFVLADERRATEITCRIYGVRQGSFVIRAQTT